MSNLGEAVLVLKVDDTALIAGMNKALAVVKANMAAMVAASNVAGQQMGIAIQNGTVAGAVKAAAGAKSALQTGTNGVGKTIGTQIGTGIQTGVTEGAKKGATAGKTAIQTGFAGIGQSVGKSTGAGFATSFASAASGSVFARIGTTAANNLKASFRGAGQQIGNSLANGIKNAAGAAVRSLLDIQNYAEFDKAGRRVETIAKGQRGAYQSSAQGISEELGYSQTSAQILGGQYQALSSGYSKQAEIDRLVTAAGKLAGIAGEKSNAEETTGAVAKIAAILKDVGFDGTGKKKLDLTSQKDFDRVAGMVSGFVDAAVGIDEGLASRQLGKQLGASTPLGLDPNQVLGAIAAASQKISPGTIFAGFPQFLTGLSKRSKPTEAGAKILGYKEGSNTEGFNPESLRRKGLEGFLADLGKKLDAVEKLSGKGARLEAFSKLIPSSQARATLAPLLADPGQISAATKTVKDADVNEKFATIQAGILAREIALKNRLVELDIQLKQGFAGEVISKGYAVLGAVVGKVVEVLESLSRWYVSLSPQQQQFASTLGAIAVVAVAVGAAIAGIALVVGLVFPAIAAGFAIVTSGAAAMAAGVAVAAAATGLVIFGIIKVFEPLRNAIYENRDTIIGWAKAIYEPIVKVGKAFLDLNIYVFKLLYELARFFSKILSDIVNAHVAFGVNLYRGAVGIMINLYNGFSKGLTDIKNIFDRTWKKINKDTNGELDKNVNFIKKWANYASLLVGGASFQMIGSIAGFIEKLFSGQKAAQKATSGITQFFQDMANAIGNIMQPVFNILDKAIQKLQSIPGAALDGLRNFNNQSGQGTPGASLPEGYGAGSSLASAGVLVAGSLMPGLLASRKRSPLRESPDLFSAPSGSGSSYEQRFQAAKDEAYRQHLRQGGQSYPGGVNALFESGKGELYEKVHKLFIDAFVNSVGSKGSISNVSSYQVPPPNDSRPAFSSPIANKTIDQVINPTFDPKLTNVSRFGAPRRGRTHAGIDLDAPVGTPVMASFDGTASISYGKEKGTGYGMGYIVRLVGIAADGISKVTLRYLHLGEKSLEIWKGRTSMQVTAGQQIGYVGIEGQQYKGSPRKTGSNPHLHLETYVNGKLKNPSEFYAEGKAGASVLANQSTSADNSDTVDPAKVAEAERMLKQRRDDLDVANFQLQQARGEKPRKNKKGVITNARSLSRSVAAAEERVRKATQAYENAQARLDKVSTGKAKTAEEIRNEEIAAIAKEIEVLKNEEVVTLAELDSRLATDDINATQAEQGRAASAARTAAKIQRANISAKISGLEAKYSNFPEARIAINNLKADVIGTGTAVGAANTSVDKSKESDLDNYLNGPIRRQRQGVAGIKYRSEIGDITKRQEAAQILALQQKTNDEIQKYIPIVEEYRSRQTSPAVIRAVDELLTKMLEFETATRAAATEYAKLQKEDSRDSVIKKADAKIASSGVTEEKLKQQRALFPETISEEETTAEVQRLKNLTVLSLRAEVAELEKLRELHSADKEYVATLDAQLIRLGQIAAETEAGNRAQRESELLSRTSQALTETLNTGLKDVFTSAFHGFKDLGSIIDGIINKIADLAIDSLFQSLFKGGKGGIFGFLGLAHGARSVGSSIPNFAGGIGAAANKERAASGKQPFLAMLHKGEAVLSTLNGDAQLYNQLVSDGSWNRLKTVPNFAYGTPTTGYSGRSNNPTVTVDRINGVDFVSVEQLQGILSIELPATAQAGAALVDQSLKNAGQRKRWGL